MCSGAYAVRMAVFTHVLGVEYKRATARTRQIYAAFMCTMQFVWLLAIDQLCVKHLRKQRRWNQQIQ